MALPDNLRYIIQALRTPQGPATTTIRSGPRSGTVLTQGAGDKKDTYMAYAKQMQENGDDPKSFEEWAASQND